MPAATPYRGRANESKPADDNAALRGATLAFGAKPDVKPKPVLQNYRGTNGALAAALRVGKHLEPPQSERRVADSYIAATLAASRSSSLSPMHTGQRPLLSPATNSPLHSERSPTLPRSSSVSSNGSYIREYGQQTLRGSVDMTYPRKKKRASLEVASKPANGSNPMDSTPIPPTNKLISIFEDKSPPTPRRVSKQPLSLRVKEKDSRGPTATVTAINENLEEPKALVHVVRTRPKSASLHSKEKGVRPPVDASKSQEQPKASNPNQAVKPPPKSPKPSAYKAPTTTTQRPCRRGSVRAPSGILDSQDRTENYSSDDDSFVSASDFKENETKSMPPQTREKISKPIPPAPRRAKGMSDIPTPEDRGRQTSLHAPEMEYRGAFVPHLSGDSLANAIAASSIASSRAPSPTRAPPIPSSKGTKNALFHQHHHLEESRTPSPAKGFRQTLRKPPKDDEEDEKQERRARKKILNKHPNKHAEGNRKRWRDEITERERKRYEAVWASNKGLFLDTSPSATSTSTTNHRNSTSDDNTINQADMVLNLVVRDIWKRSRLSADVLEEVWDLVCRTRPAALTREEFVAGLWLIDQRLKGRKLPVKVSESVWGSAGRVRVIPPKKRR